MRIFQNNPVDIFPFKVESCDKFRNGGQCTLKTGEENLPDYTGVPANSVGVVEVATTPLSVTFTVLEEAPGSTIEFRTSVKDGNVYLTQTANADGADALTLAGVYWFDLAKNAWDIQQAALQEKVKAEYGG